MKKAQYYVYRNLHTNTFSVKYKGIVIDRPKEILMYDVSFNVNEKGRQRVLAEKRKNVHATVSSYRYEEACLDSEGLDEIYYNPCFTKKFMLGNRSIQYASKVLYKDNKIYLLEEPKS